MALVRDSAAPEAARRSRVTVVVGAGSSGGVVAARLSESPSEHVVLIEAGPDFTSTAELPDSLCDADNPSLEGHDWELKTVFVEGPVAREVGRYPRGRVMGGTSAVNAAIALRGIPQDYDGWAAAGLDEWSWEAVLPYFKRLETDLDHPDAPYHGDRGPVPVRRSGPAEWPDAIQALSQGLQQTGITYAEDHNAPGATGFGPTPRNKVGGFRASTAVVYLDEARRRPNLELVADALATRVVVEDGRAVGVEIEVAGARRRIDADRVVLSGGAIGTPHLLMVSGIGPREVLEPLRIPVVVDLPGVGQNLQDHPFIPLVFEVADESESRFGFRTHLRYSSGVEGCPPDDIYMTPGLLATTSMNFETSPDIALGMMTNPTLAKPRGSGWVSITTPSVTDRPEIHLDFLADAADRERLVAAVRRIYAVVTSSPVREHLGGPMVAPSPEIVADDERLLAWMREHVSTSFHGAGTARMGVDGDELAVLDGRLRVRGVDGLFVADASVMPSVTTGFTNIPCYMIGERLADWLREED